MKSPLPSARPWDSSAELRATEGTWDMTLSGLCQAPGFGNLGVKKRIDTWGKHEVKGQAWGSPGQADFRWKEQGPRLTPSSDRQFLGRRYPPVTWHRDCHSRLDPSGSPTLLPYPLKANSVVGQGIPPDRLLCPERDPRGSRCLVSLPHLHPSMAHARSEWRCTPVSVCPSVPTLMESWSQPSPLCPAMEAEPACFWLPYMNH